MPGRHSCCIDNLRRSTLCAAFGSFIILGSFAPIGCGGNHSAASSGENGGNSQPTLSSITVAPATVTLIAGQTQQLTATANYSDGSTKDVTAAATWSSSSSSVATVAAGLVTAVASGQAMITAATSGMKGSAAITANPRLATSITITPETDTLYLNSAQQFNAIATFNDGSIQDITGTAQWSSSSPATAAISGSGIVTAVAAGQTTITAASGTVSASADVTVSSSNTGVTFIDDLTDSRLMLYWPGDGSFITYSGTRNSDGTVASITGATVSLPNQQPQVFTFDSQGRESTAILSDRTLLGFNWTTSPTLVIIPAKQAGTEVVPLPAAVTGKVGATMTPTCGRGDAPCASALSNSQAPDPAAVSANTVPATITPDSSSSTPSGAFVNVTTDLGSGPKPEDNALVEIEMYYALGGNQPVIIPAPETSPGSGEYYASLPSGPTSQTPSILQTSAAKSLSTICEVPLSSALFCGPEAPECAAAVEAMGLICKAQTVVNGFYSSVNFANKSLPPLVYANVTVDGCGQSGQANLTGKNFGSYTFQAAAVCKPSNISVNPNPATVVVNGSLPLGANATWSDGLGNSFPVISSALAWSWAAGSGVPSLKDTYLQLEPLGTNTTAGWIGGKLGVSLATAVGLNPTPAGGPDTVTAVEKNSNTSGSASVTVTQAKPTLSLTVTWTLSALDSLGWNGTNTLTVNKDGTWNYLGKLTSNEVLPSGPCNVSRTESDSGTGWGVPTTLPVPPAIFTFDISAPYNWANSFQGSGCGGADGTTETGSWTTPTVTITATPAAGGYTLSTNTTYPPEPQNDYSDSNVVVSATGFLSTN